MKKIKIITVIVLSFLAFVSCKEDEIIKINNNAAAGTISFVLNKPTYANYVLENANASLSMDTLTCVQPDYGFTSAVTYTTQISLGQTFEQGTYVELATRGTAGEKISINTKELNKALIGFNGGAFTEPLSYKTVYIRLKAVISSATISATNDSLQVQPLYSNAISLKIKPYIEPLDFYYNVSSLRTWYIVGLGGNWNNSTAGLGSSLIPLGVVDGKMYDPGSGDGTFTTTVYISSGFKLIRDIESWSTSWGMTGGTYTLNSGDNITVSSPGYYKITLNSIDNKLTIEPTTTPTASYSAIGLIGSFNSWGADEALTPNTSTNSHIWYTTYTFTADSQCKLRADGKWDTNWGTPGSSDGNPIYSKAGLGVAGGKNMLETTGTYTVIFNDIDGSYYFIKK